MKKAIIAALVCINILLLVALVNANTEEATAQTIGGANGYVMVTGATDKGVDAVYVLDLRNRKLAGFRFNATGRRLDAYRGRIMTNDFKGR